ncbi:CARDB domain-containing protein [Paenibacillus sp. WLX2291]|uniref:CARDB domain-containing protein n=1 Tax=Paenibacillus sp. WLX2291 TaxID=3296934 RepID=UPI00398456A6
MKLKWFFGLAVTCLLTLPFQAYAADTPMLSKFKDVEYGSSGERLTGTFPALDENSTLTRPWEFARWTGIINYSDGSSTTINNYDVFNVKKAIGDTNFDKENGFGLVYKDSSALGELFDAFTKGDKTKVSPAQIKYFRSTFADNANDENFKTGNKIFYMLEKEIPLLRTAGIIQRMGYKFDQTKKVSEDERQAIYAASKWPELKVIQSAQSFTINYSAYGFSDRKLRLVATAKGAFPDLKRVVSLTDGKLIAATKEMESDSIKVTDFAGLREEFGDEVDVVLEDGYGRTAIQSVKLPAVSNLDFIPTSLSLTDSNQLWVKFKYVGDDFTTSDYVNERGIPMIAKVTITGPNGDSQTLQGMYTESSKKTTNGQTYSFYAGKVNLAEEAGRYKIKAMVTINNPNHEDRALEYPAVAYNNNTITHEWTRDVTDLIAQSVTVNPDALIDGDSAQVTAKVKNVGPTTQGSVLIRFSDNGKTVYEVNKTLPANDVTTVGPFSWKGEGEGNHNLEVDVDPKEETDDIDYSNNVAVGTCLVVGKDGSTGTCGGSNVSKSWSVTYPTITGYKKNSKGKRRPVWEYKRVTYNESLQMSAEVNTKQGIITDPNNPKASDNESRGSWEIIPWAKKNGKNPNAVTRAGYGFELNVTTTYDTNWETKVPHGYEGTAKKIGGIYHGPTKVVAVIYNTKGKKVDTVDMEQIAGDKDQATWIFPKHTTVSPVTGERYTDRKWYIDENTRDGDYTVKITTDAVGKHGLIACTSKKVTIFGSMYDDTQDLRVYSK